jgi:predicted esterase
MQQHDFTINFKARFYTLGNITENTKQIWFVLHGYGQLAGYFIRKFTPLQEQNVFIIAPEGLSRFYLENLQGTSRASDRVGATWMTRENRQVDIENYLHYLNTLFEKQVGSANKIPVTVFGFSQGAATASRWVMDRVVNFNRLILWSGIFPPDMDFELGKEILQHKETFFVYGKSDPYINDDRFKEMNLMSAKLGITPQIISFDGQHEVEEKTLLKFV